jgi:hypothetical protein
MQFLLTCADVTDSCRTRLIQHNASSVVGIGKTSNVEFVSQIVRNEGALALYKGLLPTVSPESVVRIALFPVLNASVT